MKPVVVDFSSLLPSGMRERRDRSSSKTFRELACMKSVQDLIKSISTSLKDGSLRGFAKRRAEAEFLLAAALRLEKQFGGNVEKIGGVDLNVRVLKYTASKKSCGVGRVYASAIQKNKKNGKLVKDLQIGLVEPRRGDISHPPNLSLQGMPGALRKAACGGFARDFDFVNCHFQLCVQLANVFKGIKSCSMSNVSIYINNRTQVIQDVSEFYGLRSDASTFLGFRKELVKKLFLQIMFGGSVSSWASLHASKGMSMHSPFVLSVQRELKDLRSAVEKSPEFSPLWKALFASKREERKAATAYKQSVHAISCSVFSLILQTIEHDHMSLLASVFETSGVEVISLQYDGILVEAGGILNFEPIVQRAIAEIFEQTGFKVEIIEKPMMGLNKSSPMLLRSGDM